MNKTLERPNFLDILERMTPEAMSEPALDIKCRRCGVYYASKTNASCPNCGRVFCQECKDEGWIINMVEMVPVEGGGHEAGKIRPADPGEKPTPAVPGMYGWRKVAVRCAICTERKVEDA